MGAVAPPTKTLPFGSPKRSQSPISMPMVNLASVTRTPVPADDEGIVTSTMGTASPSATIPGATISDTGPRLTPVSKTTPDEPAIPPPTPSPLPRPRTPGGYSMTRDDSKEEAPKLPGRIKLEPAQPPERTSDAPKGPNPEEGIAAELAHRADRLKQDDPIGSARAWLELGLVAEWGREERDDARKHYEAARKLVPTFHPALYRMRRLLGQKPERAEALQILQDEIGLAESDEMRADLHASRGRLFEAGNQLPQARTAYLDALKFHRLHPAALRGLEAVLRRELASGKKDRAGELAEHLLRLAESYGASGERGKDADIALAAWLHVERAEILENELKDSKLALESLERGVELEPNPGPVRASLVRHLVVHDNGERLGVALRVEGEREADNARASRMFYAAARIMADRAKDTAQAISLLIMADGRAPQGSPTRARVLDDLAALYDADGNFTKVAEIRQKRLALVTQPSHIAFEYGRLADAYQRLGRPDVAADMAGRALQHEPSSQATRDRLDAALQRLGRHADRVRTYVLEANSERPIRQRIAAYRRAADICVRHLNQKQQAIETLRAAWVLEPGHVGLFEDLSALLQGTQITQPADVQRVEARLDLYLQAEAIEHDKSRKIALLEKTLSIYEDELGDPKRAMEIVDRILVIEPGRRTGLLALSRNARRANDNERLSRALGEEAKITDDAGLRTFLLLEAAELAERVGDRDRALALVDRAITSSPKSAEALRARVNVLKRAQRFDEARKALTALVAVQTDDRFETWFEIAELDESNRKAPLDAVAALREAAMLRPDHPLPRVGTVRLLRAAKLHDKLVEQLDKLGELETDALSLMHLLITRAEVEELCLGKDTAAALTLERADEASRMALANDETPYDPLVLEALERIYTRRAVSDPSDANIQALTRLYARWLERKPIASLDHSLRVSLAGVLSKVSPQQAVDVLEALVTVVPGHVPALRRLEHLHRDRSTHASLTQTLYAEASVFGSRAARAGALWELVAMEEKVGPSTTLDALSRITHEFPRDSAALDTVMRVASKLVMGVGVPHPALLAARAQMLSAIHARREMTSDALGKAAFFLEEAILCERAETDSETRIANDAYGDALALWPDSLVAARGLDRLATKLGDAKGVIKSQLALAKLVENPVQRAAHLVRAADLLISHMRDERAALEHYEAALLSDPENRSAAVALSRLLKGDPRRLVERLRGALDRVRGGEQIVVLGCQIAIATLELGETQEERPDYGPAIAGMQRVLGVNAEDVGSQFLLARLYQAQKAWSEARDTLLRIVQLATDPKARIAAHFQLADIYEGPLGQIDAAQETLTQLLGIDPKSKAALERLYQLAVKIENVALVRSTLGRLAENETDFAARTEYFLRLADVCQSAGDGVAMAQALGDAIVSSPQDLRPWTQLGRAYRTETTEGAAAFARVLEQIIELARARRRPLEARWLLTLGLIEVNVLKRATDGVAHLQSAAAMGAVPEMRAALGQGLLAVGRNKEAAIVLRELLTNEADTMMRLAEPSQFSAIRGATIASTGTVLSATLHCLDAALAVDGRAEERLPVEEVRSALGEIPTERVNQLRTRRLEPEAPYANAYGGSEISRALLPEARSPVIDGALALAPIAAKALRFELSSLGIGSRERLNPRDMHPTRVLADRVARALGVPEFEIYLTPSWQGAMRAYPGDPPALVGHISFTDLTEAEQIFGLGRLMLRIAVGMAWLDEIPVDVGDALIVSAMRCVLPQFGVGELGPAREHAAQQIAPSMQRAIGRKQRRLLEELAPSLLANFDFRAVSIGVRRSEYRTGYVLSGNLMAAIDYLRMYDAEIARSIENPRLLLQHPVTNELIRYAISPESYAERRRIGTVWNPS